MREGPDSPIKDPYGNISSDAVRELRRRRDLIEDALPEDIRAQNIMRDTDHTTVVRLTHARTGTEVLMRLIDEVFSTPALLKTAVQNALREGWGGI